MKRITPLLLSLVVVGPLSLSAGEVKTGDTPVIAPVPRKLIGYFDSEFIPGQTKWRVHDAYRPQPRIISPGTASTQNKPGRPPSDAIVLFDGSDLSGWVGGGNKPAQWKVENGYMEANGSGSIRSKQAFGSCQLHVEWTTPTEIKGESQGRGNSGVIIMGFYEVQVLDSFNNRTYADGQASAVYGQYPPLVNASRAPGQWQTYDIIFEAPQFDGNTLAKPAYVTVLHNGVLVHHRVKILGRVAHKFAAKYAPHADKLPLLLQDHRNPVRYRNIWYRPLTNDDQTATN